MCLRAMCRKTFFRRHAFLADLGLYVRGGRRMPLLRTVRGPARGASAGIGMGVSLSGCVFAENIPKAEGRSSSSGKRNGASCWLFAWDLSMSRVNPAFQGDHKGSSEGSTHSPSSVTNSEGDGKGSSGMGVSWVIGGSV